MSLSMLQQLKKALVADSLGQIKDKGYGKKYQGDYVALVGIEIDDENRNLKEFALEVVSEAG